MDFLALLKHSLYIDGNYEDEYLTFLLETSKEVVASSLDYEPQPTNNIYKQAVILLAAHYYEARLATSETELKAIPFGVNSLIQKLKGATQNENI